MDEDEAILAPSVPARRIDWFILGVNFARNLAEAASEALVAAEVLLVQHANHMVDQASFMDEARQQIESITNEE